MRMIITLILVISSISLTACSSMSGNVVPEKGPTMEQVYDSMEIPETPEKVTPYPIHANTTNTPFHKIQNPELKMYVYPHLAGKDELPVPGYYTVFNAYTQDHYVLSNKL